MKRNCCNVQSALTNFITINYFNTVVVVISYVHIVFMNINFNTLCVKQLFKTNTILCVRVVKIILVQKQSHTMCLAADYLIMNIQALILISIVKMVITMIITMVMTTITNTTINIPILALLMFALLMFVLLTLT